jgi:hypothetical protein
MKELATYAIFVIVISALALSGNKLFYALATVYEYGIYVFLGIVVIIILGQAFIAREQ